MKIWIATKESNYSDWKVLYDDEISMFSRDAHIDKNRLKYEDGILSIYMLQKNTSNYLCMDFQLPD